MSFKKHQYETPISEVWMVSVEEALLQASLGISSTRDDYGTAEEDEWD